MLLLPALLFAAQGAGAQPAKQPDPKQDEKTILELRRRYEQGDGDAALRIGNLIEIRRIPETRHGSALDWYRKGCGLQDISACHNVALAYQRGRGGAERDPSEAARHYEMAANRGFLNSMYNLAALYAETGMPATNPGEGLKWMLVAQRAAAQCPERPLCKTVLQDPRNYRKRLEEQLSSREMREVYRQAGQWQPSQPLPEPRRPLQ